MTQPLLSICIATYNRAGYISETIDSIIPQLDQDVELLIVDGASTDNTEEVVKNYVNIYEGVRYIRLPVKGGVDQDFDKTVELARGQFCWLFTDDDLIKPGAIASIKTALSQGYDLVVVNAEVLDHDLKSIVLPQRMIRPESKEYGPNDMESLYVDSLGYLSFIGAVIIRRDIWLSRQREIYFGTEFIHVGVIFQAPLEGSALVLAEPFITIRYGNAQWTPRAFDIWMFKWPALVWSFSNISDHAKICIVKQEPWRRLINLVLQRGRGAYNKKHYYTYFSKLKAAKLWKFSAWLISQLPVKIIARMLYYYGRITKADSLLLFDLKLKGKI